MKNKANKGRTSKVAKVFLSACLIVSLFFLQSCGTKEDTKTEIQVSVAASLKEAMTEIRDLYVKEHPTQEVALDFGGSGAIREKVLSGAPIDGVFLASQSDTQTLVDEDALEDPKEVLTNQLVVVSPTDLAESSGELKDVLLETDKIAIGEPQTVPAGKYAVETLENLGIYAQVEPNLVQASDVRQVLSYVESGNATVGFVYQTDAKITDKVKVIDVVDSDLHAPIVYLTGIVKESENQEAVAQFNEFLTTTAAKEIFESYGFTVSE